MTGGEHPFYLTPPPDYVLAAFEANDQSSPIPFPEIDEEDFDGEPDFWWRVLPNNKSYEHQEPIGADTGLSPHETVRITIAHLAILETVGIANPVAEYYFADHADPAQARLYTRTHHVSGLDWLDLSERRHRDKLEIWGARLQAYVDRVATAEPWMLWDTHNLKQYRWGTTAVDPTDRLYLIDPDPFVGPPQANMEQYMLSFRRWRYYGQTGPGRPAKDP